MKVRLELLGLTFGLCQMLLDDTSGVAVCLQVDETALTPHCALIGRLGAVLLENKIILVTGVSSFLT